MPEMTAEEYAAYLKELEGGTKSAYELQTVDLTSVYASPGIEVEISGKYLYVFSNTWGSLRYINVRINHSSAPAIPIQWLSGIPVDFTRVFVENSLAQGATSLLYLLATKLPGAGMEAMTSVFRPWGNTETIKVGRAEINLYTARLTSAGNFLGTAGTLYWLTIRPSAAVWLCALANKATTGTVVWDIGDPVGSAPMHIVFDPPMGFSVAIRLETATNLASATAGYMPAL